MKKNICLVVANYYPKISKALIIGSSKILKSNGIKNYKVIKVPGVFEIPYVIKKNIKRFDAFIVLGCVIKGETPHFDYISRATINALMTLSVTFDKPIGNGIITCLSRKQAFARQKKGKEAAIALLSVLKSSKASK